MSDQKSLKILHTIAEALCIIFITVGLPLIIPSIFGLITLFYLEKIKDIDEKRNLNMSLVALLFFNVFVGSILVVDWYVCNERNPQSKDEIFKSLRKLAKGLTIVWIIILLPTVILSLIGFMVLKYLMSLDEPNVDRSLAKTIISFIFTPTAIGMIILADYLVYSRKKLTIKEVFRMIVYSLVVIFLFLYIFSIPALSGRPTWYIISYFFMAGLIGSTLLYSLIFSKIKFNKWLFIPFGFVLFAGVGTLLYSHQFRMWITLVLMMITLVTFYYAFVSLDNVELVKRLLIYAFWLFGLYFAFIYRDYILHLRISGARLGKYFDNENTIGFYFAIGFTISLFTALFSKSRIDLIYIIFALFFAVLGFFTGSRAFLVSLAASIIVILYFKFRKHKVFFFVGLAALVGVYIAMINLPRFAFLKDQFDRTIYTLFGVGYSKPDTSTIQRAVWPGYAFYMGGKNLLFGYGCNGFALFSGIGTYAHNNYAEVICNFGIIGFSLFHACYIIPIFLSYKPKNVNMFLVPVFAIVFLTRNIFGVTYYTKEAYLVLGLLFYLTKDSKLPLFGSIKTITKVHLKEHEVSI